MSSWKSMAAVAVFAVMGVSGAHSASVICGDGSLGIRTVTVDPADPLGLCYADLTNLGDGALIALVDSLIGTSAPSTLIDRDTANSNGSELNITGVSATSGGWAVDPGVWDDFGRVFLYFHFGDAQDNPGPGSSTDPDIFIVELASPDVSGTWTFSGQQTLSNIALIGAEADGGGGGGGGNVPEPMTLALMGIGLAGLGFRRRRSR